MITLQYSIVIEATSDPSFFGFYSPDLPGFTGVGTSIGNCVEEAHVGIDEHFSLLLEQGMPVPPRTPDGGMTIHHQRGLADTSGF